MREERSVDWRTTNILDLPRIYAVTSKAKSPKKTIPKSGRGDEVKWNSLSPTYIRYDAQMTLKKLLAFDPDRIKIKKEKPQSPSWKQLRFNRAKIF